MRHFHMQPLLASISSLQRTVFLVLRFESSSGAKSWVWFKHPGSDLTSGCLTPLHTPISLKGKLEVLSASSPSRLHPSKPGDVLNASVVPRELQTTSAKDTGKAKPRDSNKPLFAFCTCYFSFPLRCLCKAKPGFDTTLLLALFLLHQSLGWCHLAAPRWLWAEDSACRTALIRSFFSGYLLSRCFCLFCFMFTLILLLMCLLWCLLAILLDLHGMDESLCC